MIVVVFAVLEVLAALAAQAFDLASRPWILFVDRLTKTAPGAASAASFSA